MLAIVTGFTAGGLHVLAVTRHLHVLAPRAVVLAPRGGTAGGYWGMAQGSAVTLLGLVGLFVRRLAGVEAPVAAVGFTVGALMVMVGLVAAYRLSLLEAHDHPHTHDGVAHEHIHLHATPGQLHDHDQSDFDLAGSALGVSNLAAVLPALALGELDAIVYLVTYLAVSILSMGALGSWLGRARRQDQEEGAVLRLGNAFAYGLSAVGLAWMALQWPF